MAETRRIMIAAAFVAGVAGCTPQPQPPSLDQYGFLGICVEGPDPTGPMGGTVRRVPDGYCTEGRARHDATAVLWLSAADTRPVPAVGESIEVSAGTFDAPTEDSRRRIGTPDEGAPTVADAWRVARRG